MNGPHSSDRSETLGDRLISSLRSLRDQLKVSSEGTMAVPVGTPRAEIEAFTSRQMGIRQFYPGTVRQEGGMDIYSIVFDLAKIGSVASSEAPSWLSQAKFKTAEGTTIIFRQR